MELAVYQTIFSVAAFVLGAVIGSFLNVCIHRMPRGLSVNKPRRSFCPSCGKGIPWSRNLPVVSWLLLRGRCADCGARISVRYFLVEVLTGALFLALWIRFPPQLAIVYWVMVSLFVVATFIDFEHFIIPDFITWGGVAAGVAGSLLIPELMGVDTWWRGGLWSLAAAAAGYFTLWGVVEAGKLAFGRKRIELDGVQPFRWVRDGEDAELRIGDETLTWSEMFARESDVLVLDTKGGAKVDGETVREERLQLHYESLQADGRNWDLNGVDVIEGRLVSLIIPREAMGFGDVKFIASIGAFLGWKAVFVTIFAASVVGSIVGVATILMGRREWSARIPFGPYLALGALIWLFAGEALLEWYGGLLAGGR